MDLIILHCQCKHKISVDNTEGNDLTVLDLKHAAANATNVPVESQKLIFKGKSLNDPSQLLQEVGLKNGSKVMLIGKKVDIEADVNFKKIKDIEKKTADFEKKQLEIQEEIQGIQKGFLPDDLVADALKRLQKRLAVCQEEFMRLLEQLDTLSIGENHMVIRSKRKATVQVIQGRLDFNDSLDKKIIDFSQP
ncbi:BAG family molecular chaperone regulator 1-like [Anneissia japonica]|uniref:BAG family molecular chaperone regulator 1-like n=1 Tax=Anneissia japonica TaxID=1529436 RepID=UPI001425AF2A|nr:BAG family molecular chaperone regulator 1-like [Anneissia japonica]XP_033106271.1 BAG family molecular chaperone regulator 1-like [Anneissia japonica]